MVVILVSTLTFIVVEGIGLDWYAAMMGTAIVSLVLIIASYNIIAVQKELDSLRTALDSIEENSVIGYKLRIKELQGEAYKRRIEELENEVSVLRKML